MTDLKPLLVVPATANLSRAFDADVSSIRVSSRACRNGILVIAPAGTQPNALMVSCSTWPVVLRPCGVTRVAVLLGVQSYALAEPVLRSCIRCMKQHGLAVAYFHEGHLESDHVQAWFERRKARRRITSDSMVRLSHRYAERDDPRGASHALAIAEQLAGRLTTAPEPERPSAPRIDATALERPRKLAG